MGTTLALVRTARLYTVADTAQEVCNSRHSLCYTFSMLSVAFLVVSKSPQ